MNEMTTTMNADAAEIERLRTQVRALQTARDENWRKLETYRAEVRDIILTWNDDNDLASTEQVNDLLEQLGLEKVTQTFDVTWREMYVVWVERSGTVEATDAEDAEEQVNDDPDTNVNSDDDIAKLVREQVDFGDYEVDDRNGPEFVTVEPQS